MKLNLFGKHTLTFHTIGHAGYLPVAKHWMLSNEDVERLGFGHACGQTMSVIDLGRERAT